MITTTVMRRVLESIAARARSECEREGVDPERNAHVVLAEGALACGTFSRALAAALNFETRGVAAALNFETRGVDA